MTKEEAFSKMLEYSFTLNNCCCHIEKCIQTGKCKFGYEAEECGFYDAFMTVKNAMHLELGETE